MYKVHYPEPSMPGVAHTCNPSIQGWKQENQEFKIFFGYIANLRLAWVLWDPAHYPHLKEYIQEVSFHRYGKLGLHCYLWRARCTNLCTCRVPSHFYYVCTGCWRGTTAARRARCSIMRIRVWIPALPPMSDSLQVPIIPTPRDWMPFSGFWGHLHTHVHTLTKTYKYINLLKVCM